MSAGPAVRRRAALFLVSAAAVAGAVAGWRLFWFLTDDAYIAFRYAANSLAGHGLVWNPPPFRPVEGYTSFLWVVLLRAVWRWAGIEPPAMANALSLGCGLATLALAGRWLWRLRLPEPLAQHRVALLALVWLGVITNRTFLAWLSSGLETALSNLLFTGWLYLALQSREARGRWWGPRLAAVAALAALTRPDGLLLAAATLAIVILARPPGARSPAGAWARAALAAWPLAALAIHLFWRRSYYGEWLPNTYAAKAIGVWPASGGRYLASFAFEYGLWLWVLLALAAWLASGRPGWPGLRERIARGGAPAAVAGAALAAHLAYYTLVIGGDHFEYRVLSHLVPLLFLLAVALVARTRMRPREALVTLALMVFVSWPLPWIHWLETRGLRSRAETYELARPIAPHFAAPLRPAVALWDRWQSWLIGHSVGMRHQEHKIFHTALVAMHPSRAAGAALGWESRPVIAAPSVGVLGWVLPNVAVIDRFGLNDRVIARSSLTIERAD